jgi:putative glutamine amidotransferase
MWIGAIFHSMPHSPPLPLVLVTAPVAKQENADWIRVRRTYTNALTRAGLIPVIVPPLADLHQAAPLLSRMSGLMLTGGEDIVPDQYGAAPHPKLGATSPERDAWEIALVRAAAALRCPTLAICRGAQVLNVACGGTLIQDIPTDRPGTVDHCPNIARDVRAHAVTLDAESRITRIAGAQTVHVNSIHHQAVDAVAPSLWATGVASDGIPESFESRDYDWWLIAVQWHPEELDRDGEPWDRNIFAAFAEEIARS